MSLSGSKDFELDVTEYIEEAFERCGLVMRTGYDLKTAKRSMNLLFADWANRGLNQWTIEQVSITLADGIAEYPAGTLTMTVAASGAFSVPETITGGTSGATASITSLPTSTSMALTIPSGTFSSGETITGGTSGATTTVSSAVSFQGVQSTIDILAAVVRRDSTDYNIQRISRGDYIGIPNKTTEGRPSQIFVNKQITPTITLWPTPDKNTDVVLFDRLVRMDDADGYIDTLQMPFRFYPALAAGLAYYLSMKKAPDRVPLLKNIYDDEIQRAISQDADRTSFNIVPATNGS
tara:strand:+ start:118 stop:996 length:879 start_codon:yes stop_codon:yes gene_type:complete